jgi:BlaI family penicillinase repressor
MKELGLTQLQVDIMRVLWDRGEATVGEVYEVVGVERGLAQATIATLLRRLEKKGAVTHKPHGRQFVYMAAVTSDAVRRSMLTDVAEKLLPAEVPALINQLFASKKIGADELEQVKKLIEQKEREALGE